MHIEPAEHTELATVEHIAAEPVQADFEQVEFAPVEIDNADTDIRFDESADIDLEYFVDSSDLSRSNWYPFSCLSFFE